LISPQEHTSTMSNAAQRPSLGQIASIGTLYDARSDSFLPLSLLKDLPPDGILKTNTQKVTVQVSYIDSYEEKFGKIGVGNELGGSILAGLVNTSGSGCYLGETRESNENLQAAVYHKIITSQEKLNFMSNEIKDHLAFTVLRSSEVTHVVTGIEWGAQSIVTARHRLLNSIEGSGIEGQFRAEIETFKSAIENSRPINPGNSNRPGGTGISLEITAYSDVLENEGIMMHNFQEAYDFLELMPLNIKNDNGGKGKPIVYSLLPVGMLSFFLPVEVDVDITATPPSPECLKRFVQLFDEFRDSQQRLNDYQSYVSKYKLYMHANHVQTIADRVRNMKAAEQTLKTEYARVLQDVRCGTSEPEKLWQLHRDFIAGDLSPKKIATVADDYREKVEFINMMVAKGATYIGYNGLNLGKELSKQGGDGAYVFSFSGAARKDVRSWEDNQTLLLELLNEPNRKGFIAIVDCDATATALEKAHISYYEKGQEVFNDLLEHRQFLADKCFARYTKQSLETRDIQKPLKRRFVKIACPGRNCSPNEACDWICPVCLAPVEYGYSDQYIYCDCGRSLYSNYDFKCCSKVHGPGFEPYDRNVLLSFLQSLDQSNYLNILILGETGVGKSTFINAFVNYLTFETLEESMKAEKLNWVIPCSFSTQIMDRSNPDGAIQQIEVKVGSRDDERDGSKGASATQQTTVYPVTIGSSTIRLIDTPGIGDTRGIDFDRKNMADILSTLSSYDELHGVLILLKSNNARLTVTFSFCVKELLKHLHRSAAKNMVFGFTNTRISNYTPGDTFGPLETLLKQHPNVGLSLSIHTTYCFDSESFRYLAAFKNGISMPNEEDFRRSWKHSRDEAWRLINHFKSRPPHQVRSTISLNGTRELISELTKPMADISQLIRTNIGLCEDRVQELKDTRLSGDKLRKRLNLQKVQLKSEELDKPRTVCTDPSCMEYKDDGNGNNTIVAIYKTHCHPVCHLTDVQVDTVAHPGLINCAAFNGSNNCNNCYHHWQQHLHVLYELHEHTATVTDTEIERQLRANADDVTLKQTAISEHKQMIEEYRREHEQIRKAGVQFGAFLKKHSITPYNDATLAYLDFLIKEEKAKIQAGGNRKKLQALEEDRQKHEEEIKILTENMQNDANCQPLDEEGVDLLVKQLYNLKHFGNNLKSVKHTIAAAHQATYREMPYRVKSNGSWGWSALQGMFDTSHPPNHSTTRNQGGVRQRPPSTRFSTMNPFHMPSAPQHDPGHSTTTSLPLRNPTLQGPNQGNASGSSSHNFSFPSIKIFGRK
jgi:GTPase SAR1 family protein